MEILNQITIHRPMEEVFEFLMNFENMSKWNYYILSVKNTTEGVIKKGSTFRQVRKNDSQHYSIIDLHYPRMVAIETLPSERHIVLRFTLFEEGNATRVDEWITIDVSWIVKLVAQWRVKSAVKENMTKLKILLETGEVVLQDGRAVDLST